MYLVSEDMQEIRELINTLLPVNYYTRSLPGNRKPQTCCYMYSPRLCEALMKSFDFQYKSSKVFSLDLEWDFLKFVIRGFIDGDGCFFMKRYKRGLNVSFNISGTYDFDWNILEHVLKSNNILYKIVRYSYPNKNSRFSRLIISRRSELKKFINLIYGDNIEVGLRRKYIKAKNILIELG